MGQEEFLNLKSNLKGLEVAKPTSFSSVPEDPGGRPLCRLPALARPRPHLSSALRRRSTPDAQVEETERMRFHKKHIFQFLNRFFVSVVALVVFA